jgi:hypothetical protein
VTTGGGLAKTSTGAKALSSANKIDHIPLGLESYQTIFSNHRYNHSWQRSANWVQIYDSPLFSISPG